MRADSQYLLADHGKSDWKIVVGADAIAPERHAAEELQYFLREISGAHLAIVADNVPLARNEIIVGDNKHLFGTGVQLDCSKLGSEGFCIQTAGGSLVIAGGKPRGTLYGVYTFLEDYLGCRWFYRKVSRIPKRDKMEIGEIHDEQIPALEYRDPYFAGSVEGEWHARNKSNSHFARLEDIHGYKVVYSHFVHTFDSLLPVAKYFDSHPEYFSEVDGRRISDRTQLCLTNPDVLKISISSIQRWLKEEPKASIVSVSQNDWRNPCQCGKCKAIDEYEGSHSGTLIRFVNEIAEALEHEFPHVAVDTLAYQYTRKPPRHVRPRKNVIVRLCSIECCFAHPLEKCHSEVGAYGPDRSRTWVKGGFSDDLEAWSKVCDRLYVWDYVTNFQHYVQPFPNFKVLQANIRYFVKHHVKGIFEEGNNSAKGESSECDQMRQYVLAKLLWNPDYDVEVAVNEFMTAYYGMAAAAMRRYYDLIHKQVEAPGVHMSIYDPPTSAYLNETMLDEADRLFDKAEMIADNEEVLKRVRTARLPIRYVRLCIAPADAAGLEERIERFFEDVKAAQIKEIAESRPLEESRTLMLKRVTTAHNLGGIKP
ncbi:MAG: DUF4838 domain-containing protein [Candidatus Brocadiia bacterium]